MRPLLLVLLLSLAAAGPAAAEPPLIGGPPGGPLRLLDNDLRVVPGSPRVPSRNANTAVSPDNKRFAGYGRGRMSVFEVATGRRVRTLAGREASRIVWPTRRSGATSAASSSTAPARTCSSAARTARPRTSSAPRAGSSAGSPYGSRPG